MNRRNVVIFLALIGIFITFTQAYTISYIQFDYEASSLSRYEGPEAFLITYDSKPLGKNKVLGTLNVKNQLGIGVTTSVTIIPTNSSDQSIEIGSVTTFDYKINDGTWSTLSYGDPDYMYAEVDVSLSAGETKTLYIIFEKSNLAVDYYLSTIVIQQKGTS